MTDALGNLMRREIHARHVDPATFIKYDAALALSGLEQQAFNALVHEGRISARESGIGYLFDPYEIKQAIETTP